MKCTFNVNLCEWCVKIKPRYSLDGIIMTSHKGNFLRGLKSTHRSTSASISTYVVEEYLLTKIRYYGVAGSFRKNFFQQSISKEFGAIPKHNQPNKCCLIVDLYYPAGDGRLVESNSCKEEVPQN